MRHTRTLQISLFSAILAVSATCPPNAYIQERKYEGLEHTELRVVQRQELNIAKGQLDTAYMAQEIREWQELDLFADIHMDCELLSKDTVVLKTRFTELFQYLPAPAMKQSDQDGWMAGGALAALNFLGQDIRMEVQARFTVEPWMQAKEYAFYASSPYWGDLPLDWKMDYVDVDSWDPLRNYAEKSHNAQVEVKYPWRYPWQIAALGGYRGIEHKNQDQLDWLDASIDQALFAGIGAIWDTRDSRTSTQKGLYSEWLLVKNGIANLRSSSHWEMLWDFETNHRLGRNDVIKTGWLFRYRVGSVGFYDRYQQGGANTLRGYFPDSSAHGNSELLYNAEIRKRIVQRKSISLFDIHGYYALDAVLGSDIGLLWDDKLPKAESARSGIYAGIHIVVPAIERVRIEAGINPQNGAWAVTVGLFEKRITQRWRSR